MAYDKKKQRRNFWLVLIPFLVVIFFAYKLQFKMQRSVSYFDNYEIFDCQLFHNSIGNQKFSEDDMAKAQIDQSTLDDYTYEQNSQTISEDTA